MLQLKPARYLPLFRDHYDIGPGLHPLGHDFGNGRLDACVLQVDGAWPDFRRAKLETRQERAGKYVVSRGLNDQIAAEAARTLCQRACTEWPEHFSWEDTAGALRLHCRLSGEILEFDSRFLHVRVINRDGEVRELDAIEALLLQFQEDLAVVALDEDGRDRLVYLNVSFPSHWSPEEKAGLDFASVHRPVPGFAVAYPERAAQSLVRAMMTKGPYQRFVWSFVTDTRLNRHPEPAPGEDPILWRGRSFDPEARERAAFYLRVERQVTLGLPQADAALFFIRLSFIDGRDLRLDPAARARLLAILRSMSPEARRYKGVEGCFDELVAWLGG